MKKTMEEKIKEQIEWENEFKNRHPWYYQLWKKNNPGTPKEICEKAEKEFANIEKRK